VLTKIPMQFTSFLEMIYVSVGAVREHKITGPMFGRINKFILLFLVHFHWRSKRGKNVWLFHARKCHSIKKTFQ
jgi:hypothetical protein